MFTYIESERPDRQLAWLDRAGRRIETLGEPEAYYQVALSPDGSRVALEVFGENGMELWIMDVSRGVARRLTSASGGGSDPVWSPDGQELIYHFDGNALRQGLHAGAPAVPLFDPATNDQPANWPESWSSDGESLLYVRSSDIWALPLAGGGSPEPLLESESNLDEPQLSPDGRWLAYISNESGVWEVYVEPFHRPGERIRVSTDGGGQPKWRRDGQELFYTSHRNVLMAVEVQEEAGGLVVGLPTELFEIPVPVQRPVVDDYAVSPDGQRFLVKTRPETGGERNLHVLVNWTSLLE